VGLNKLFFVRAIKIAFATVDGYAFGIFMAMRNSKTELSVWFLYEIYTYIKTGSHGTIKRTVTAHVEPSEKAGTKSNVQHESNQNEPEARFNTRSLSIRIGQGIGQAPLTTGIDGPTPP